MLCTIAPGSRAPCAIALTLRGHVGSVEERYDLVLVCSFRKLEDSDLGRETPPDDGLIAIFDLDEPSWKPTSESLRGGRDEAATSKASAAAQAAAEEALAKAAAIPSQAAAQAQAQVDSLVADAMEVPGTLLKGVMGIPETLRNRVVKRTNRQVDKAKTKLEETKLRLAQTRLEVAKEKKRQKGQ